MPNSFLQLHFIGEAIHMEKADLPLDDKKLRSNSSPLGSYTD